MDDEVRIRLLMEGNWEEIVLTEVLNGNWHHERTGCPAGSGVFVEMDPNWRGHKKQRERNNTHVPSYQHFLVSKGRRKEDHCNRMHSPFEERIQRFAWVADWLENWT